MTPERQAADIWALAEIIDVRRTAEARTVVSEANLEALRGATAGLLVTAHPPFLQQLRRDPDLFPGLDRSPTVALPALNLSEVSFKRELRRHAIAGRMSTALLEALPPHLGGKDVEYTAALLSELADATIQCALDYAVARCDQRWGRPLHPDGRQSTAVVLGMGKLGGLELNPGSDIDLIIFYDSDEPETLSGKSAHQFWTRAVKHMTQLLEEVTGDGFVWRVDHRLRPEGSSGPLANSVAAAERYYETFGRQWERAALLRARPVAGDRALGTELLSFLKPFIWRRSVDPSIATAMSAMILQSRDAAGDSERDLKIGSGGIREAEFFVQSLQLIWGGRDARLRETNTVRACHRLRSAGLTTDREFQNLVDGYVALRRAEHAIQHTTGLQTHRLPQDRETEQRLALVLGYSDSDAMHEALSGHRSDIEQLFASIQVAAPSQPRPLIARALVDSTPEAMCARIASLPAFAHLLPQTRAVVASSLRRLAELPHGPLRRSQDDDGAIADVIFDAVGDAADSVQAARHLHLFMARLHSQGVTARVFARQPLALRRLITVFGASSFVADSLTAHPDLGDLILFEGETATRHSIGAQMRQAYEEARTNDAHDLELCLAPLRRSQRRITTQIALADIGGSISTRKATALLSQLADLCLETSLRLSLGVDWETPIPGLAIMAMGKLGGEELGYGSDLDVIFIYDSEDNDAVARYSRTAKRVIRLLTMPHSSGRGFELDTRLRPSGNQGLLVSSLSGFESHHRGGTAGAVGAASETWERLALCRMRYAAGCEKVGQAARAVADAVTYHGGLDPGTVRRDLLAVRTRMERELSGERAGRLDVKFGRGGLLDIEFLVQYLQLTNPQVETLHTTSTHRALAALQGSTIIAESDVEALVRGYDFLRKLEQRLRIVHGDGRHLIEEGAAGLRPLARRMGLRDHPGLDAADALMQEAAAVKLDVRSVFTKHLMGVVDPN